MTSAAGTNASDVPVSSESKLSTQDNGPVGTPPPATEMGGGGSSQPKMLSQDTEEPSSPGVGLQLLDSTRQLGSRMFGMLRNRLPMGEPTTPTGHTHLPHPPPTPSSEEVEEPATPTQKVRLLLLKINALSLTQNRLYSDLSGNVANVWLVHACRQTCWAKHIFQCSCYCNVPCRQGSKALLATCCSLHDAVLLHFTLMAVVALLTSIASALLQRHACQC